MKPFKYLLALPLALTSLVACGGSTYSKIDFKAAAKMAESYKPSIKNHKASAIGISGNVNSIKIKGNATFWSYSKPIEEIEGGMDLLTLIPNFDLKNGEIVVDPQQIATTSIPGAILSSVEVASLPVMYTFLLNLPKYPVNKHMMKAFYGFEEIVMDDDGNPDWEATEEKSWEKAEVTFAKNGNGSLKITIDTDDIVAFFSEVMSAVGGGGKKVNADPEPTEKAYPLTATITTNSIGYIDSLAVKTEIKEADYEFTQMPDIVYFALDGDLTADFKLKFKQSFCKPVSIKYQLSVYKEAKDDDIPDIVWKNPQASTDPAGKVRKLKLDKDKSIDPTTDLDLFKDYVTFNWYKNLQGKILKVTHDDPIFSVDYWDRGYNIAFTNNNYDVLVIPTYGTDKKPKYNVLGAYPMTSGYSDRNTSFVTTSIDGKVISIDTGLPDNEEKILEDAGDALQNIEIDDQGNSICADEIFINSNMLNLGGSECIVNIAVAPFVE